MKIAVTGASGHIGNCLVRELIKKGHRVRALVHNFENNLAQLGAEIFKGNLLNPESLEKFCEGTEVVFHLAAAIAISNRHSENVVAVNVKGTGNIIEASKKSGVKKFIHFSSTDAFDVIPPGTVLDENKALVESDKMIYAFTKAESERIALSVSDKNFEVVILSPSAVIGPYDYRGSFLGNALIKIYRNKLPMLISGGYNWVDVRDVAGAAVHAIQHGRNGEKYILSGHFCSIKKLSVITSQISNIKTPTILAPVFLAKLACPFIQFFSIITGKKPVYTCQSLKILINAPENISNEKACKELGYSPRPLEETLKDTFNWYKQHKYIN